MSDKFSRTVPTAWLTSAILEVINGLDEDKLLKLGEVVLNGKLERVDATTVKFTANDDYNGSLGMAEQAEKQSKKEDKRRLLKKDSGEDKISDAYRMAYELRWGLADYLNFWSGCYEHEMDETGRKVFMTDETGKPFFFWDKYELYQKHLDDAEVEFRKVYIKLSFSMSKEEIEDVLIWRACKLSGAFWESFEYFPPNDYYRFFFPDDLD